MDAEKIKTWLEILAILIGSIWVVYTFGYKEWWIPNHTPVNITSTVSLTRVIGDDNNRNENLVPIELSLTANNPADRTIDLLDCIIIVSGSQVAQLNINEDSWNKGMSEALGGETEVVTQHYYNPSNSKVIAVITPFRGTDTRLGPKEELSRKHLIYIPANTFDHIEAVAILPNADHDSNVSIKWSLDKIGRVVPDVFTVSEDGRKLSITADEQNQHGIQMTTTRSQLYIFK